MFPVRIAVACVAAVVFAIKAKGSLKNRNNVVDDESAPEEPEEGSTAPECVATQHIANEDVSEVSPSETRTQSTVTANDAALAEPADLEEVSSKPGVVPGINIDAIAVGTDALEVTPRKSSFSKLIKKVSSAIPSPRKQSSSAV